MELNPLEKAIEAQGIRIDSLLLGKHLDDKTLELSQKKKLWRKQFSSDFIDSSKYLSYIFDNLGYDYLRTPKGNPDFSKESLLRYTIPTDMKDSIIDMRKTSYTLSMLKSYLNHMKDGHVYPSYKFTKTGRYVCSQPNIQNLPKEDKELRSLIIPLRGHSCLASFDYSQGEYRLFADYIGNKKLIDDLNGGADFHQLVADKVKCDRKEAKIINFSILYGAGVDFLAHRLSKSHKEAGDLKNFVLDFFGESGRDFINTMNDPQRVTVEKWTGKIIYVDEPHKSLNYLIQGGLADIVRKALCAVRESLQKYCVDGEVYFNVHDEWVLCFRKPAEESLKLVQHAMENCYSPRNGIKMKVDCKIGERFSEV